MIIPVTDDETVFSAIGYRWNGIVIATKPSRATRHMSPRGIIFLAAGNSARAPAPKARRAIGTTGAATWSIAIAMNRNEAPQVRATADVMPHSAGPKRCGVSRASEVGGIGTFSSARHCGRGFILH